MKAGIVFTGTGPMVVLTSYDSFTDERFVAKLRAKGIKKFIGYEVSLELCEQRYGEHHKVILNDLQQTDDLRVLDFDGHHVYETFSFGEYGEEFRCE